MVIYIRNYYIQLYNKKAIIQSNSHTNLLRIDLPKNGLTYMGQVVNPWPQTPRGQPVAKPEILPMYSALCVMRGYFVDGLSGTHYSKIYDVAHGVYIIVSRKNLLYGRHHKAIYSSYRGQVVVVKLCCAIIGTHNDLPSVRCQAIIWTNIGFTTWHQYLFYIIHHMAICLMVHLIGITIKYTSYITTVLKVYSLVHIYPFVGSCKWWRNSTPWTIYVL